MTGRPIEPNLGTIIPNICSKRYRENTAPGAALFGADRQAVLRVFFAGAKRRYYQRQVIETARLGSGTVQRELERLTRAGILTRTVEGRQVYFEANENCPFHAELRGLARKTLGAAQLIADGLAGLSERIALAFVFGSVAAGNENAASDVDVLIVGTGVSLAEIVNALADVQRELGREVNPAVYRAGEFSRKLAEGHQFLSRVVEGPKIFLIGDEDELRKLAPIRLAEDAQDKPAGNRRSVGDRR